VRKYSQRLLLRTCSVRISGSAQQRAAYDYDGIILILRLVQTEIEPVSNADNFQIGKYNDADCNGDFW